MVINENEFNGHFVGKSRRQVKMMKQDFDDDKRNLKAIWKSI